VTAGTAGGSGPAVRQQDEAAGGTGLTAGTRVPRSYAPGVERNLSLSKAVTILRALAASPLGLTAMQVARSTHLPRATAGRLLASLSDEGLVESTVPGSWVLGRELVRLGRAADSYRPLLELARPAVAGLASEVGESAMLGMAARERCEVILQVDPPRLITSTNWVGRDLGLHASAGGKLMLAGLRPAELREWLAGRDLPRYTPQTITGQAALVAALRQVRRQGYAETIDELEDGLTGIVVPVQHCQPALALGVSGPTSRLGPGRLAAAVAAARVAATRLSETLAIR
jgi:IclR family acetate operon transcriptional repressor